MSESAPRTPAEILSTAGEWPSPAGVPATPAVGRLGWLCALARGARVLEIGCGAGDTSFALAESGFRVTGVDTRRGLLETAKRRLESVSDADRQRLTFLTARGIGVPCESESFDSVVLSEVTGDGGDLGLALDEVLRVIRPGGLFLMAAPRGDRAEIPGDGVELLRLLATIEPRFVIEQVDLLDGYFGLVATARDAITVTPAAETWASAAAAVEEQHGAVPELHGAAAATGAVRALLRQTQRAMKLEETIRQLSAPAPSLHSDLALERLRRQGDGLRRERDGLAAELAQATAAADSQRAQAQSATLELDERDGRIEQLAGRVGELEQQAAALRRQRAEVTRWLEEEQQRTGELAGVRRDLDARLGQERRRAATLEAEHAKLAAELSRARSDLEATLAEHQRLRRALELRERRIASYEASRSYRALRWLWHLRHPRAGRRAQGG